MAPGKDGCNEKGAKCTINKEKQTLVYDDFDKFEKTKKASEEKKANNDGLDFEIEDTIEIKSLKTTGKKKKK